MHHIQHNKKLYKTLYDRQLILCFLGVNNHGFIIQLVINKVILIMQLCKSQFYLKTLSNRKFLMSNKTFYEKRKQSCFSANRYSGCFCRFSPALRAFYGKNQLFFMIFRNFEKSQNILGHLLDRGPYDVRVRSEKRTAPDKRVHPR